MKTRTLTHLIYALSFIALPYLLHGQLRGVITEDFRGLNVNGKISIRSYKGKGKVVKIPAEIDGTPVTTIGGTAFFFCADMENLIIPSSITSIECDFHFCPSLKAITVAENNPYYSSVSGVLFDAHQTKLIRYPAAKTGCYTIPTTVESVGKYAFHFDKCNPLTGITIPDAVSIIDKSAFFGLSVVTNVPSNVSSIGEYAFCGCDGLTSISIGKARTSIGKEAFRNCAHLRTVEILDGVTSIDDRTFSDCYNLTNITIGSNVSSIGASAFAGCTRLESIYFKGDAPVVGEDKNPFSDGTAATVYHLRGTSGWGGKFCGLPVAEWHSQARGNGK